jgi:MFS family permease
MVLGVLVLYMTVNLHVSKAGYGLVLGLAAIGNIIGAVAADRLHIRLGGAKSILAAGVVAAAAYPLLAATSSEVVATAALGLESAAVFVGLVAAQSLRQALVPEEFQGRAGSAYMTLILASSPLGGTAGGLLAAGFGVRTTFVIAGCLQLAVMVVAGPRLVRLIQRDLPTPPGPPEPEVARS